jgi:hypothetical protein
MFVPYIRDILRRSTRPHRAAWLIWSVLGVTASASQYADGARISLLMTLGQATGTVITFVLSFWYGEGGLRRNDVIGLATAAVGLALWYVSGEPLVALACAIAVDSVAAALTAAKAYRDPASETLSAWVLSATSGVLGTISVGRLDASLLAFPVYVIVANSAVIAAILLGRRVAAANVEAAPSATRNTTHVTGPKFGA